MLKIEDLKKGHWYLINYICEDDSELSFNGLGQFVIIDSITNLLIFRIVESIYIVNENEYSVFGIENVICEINSNIINKTFTEYYKTLLKRYKNEI